jgi:3-hydroxymyristoyl/3-hydroxydecanoyl-(acyl carrier protein) dehydratase
VAASPAIEGNGVSNDLAHIATWLRNHPWVDDAQCGYAADQVPGALLACTPEGIDALCRQGRKRVVDALQEHVDTSGNTGGALVFRLFDTMPILTSAHQIDALLQAPLPHDVAPDEEHEQDGVWILALRIPLDLVYFPGHFPQAPVLPGAVQVAWALSLAAARLGTPIRCHVMEALKFQQLLRPGDRVDLTFHHDPVRRKLHFAYRYGEKAYSSGRLAWSAAS